MNTVLDLHVSDVCYLQKNTRYMSTVPLSDMSGSHRLREEAGQIQMARITRGFLVTARLQREAAAAKVRAEQEAAAEKVRLESEAAAEKIRLESEAAAATVLQAGYRGYNARKAFETSRAARLKLEARTTRVQASGREVLFNTNPRSLIR